MNNEKTPTQLVIEGCEAAHIGYGDIINLSDINHWSGVELPDMNGLSKPEQRKAFQSHELKMLGIRQGLKDFLLEERLMYLQTVPGSGYRVVKPAEQTEVAVKKGMRAINKGLKDATKGVEMVNTAMLTSSEREYNQSVGARLAGLATLIGKKRDYLTIK